MSPTRAQQEPQEPVHSQEQGYVRLVAPPAQQVHADQDQPTRNCALRQQQHQKQQQHHHHHHEEEMTTDELQIEVARAYPSPSGAFIPPPGNWTLLPVPGERSRGPSKAASATTSPCPSSSIPDHSSPASFSSRLHTQDHTHPQPQPHPRPDLIPTPSPSPPPLLPPSRTHSHPHPHPHLHADATAHAPTHASTLAACTVSAQAQVQAQSIAPPLRTETHPLPARGLCSELCSSAVPAHPPASDACTGSTNRSASASASASTSSATSTSTGTLHMPCRELGHTSGGCDQHLRAHDGARVHAEQSEEAAQAFQPSDWTSRGGAGSDAGAGGSDPAPPESEDTHAPTPTPTPCAAFRPGPGSRPGLEEDGGGEVQETQQEPAEVLERAEDELHVRDYAFAPSDPRHRGVPAALAPDVMDGPGMHARIEAECFESESEDEEEEDVGCDDDDGGGGGRGAVTLGEHEVLYAFEAESAHEMGCAPGDRVVVVGSLSGGWAVVERRLAPDSADGLSHGLCAGAGAGSNGGKAAEGEGEGEGGMRSGCSTGMVVRGLVPLSYLGRVDAHENVR